MPILNWRELQYLNDKRQFGDLNEIDTSDKPWLEGWDPSAENAQKDYADRLVNSLMGDGSLASRHAVVKEATEAMPSIIEQKAELADEMGYGENRRDYRYAPEDWINDPVDYRANSQTSASKLKNGAFKFLPYAVSTFVDNTAGLVDGLLVNQAVDMFNGDNEYNFGKSFRNTWTARTMDNFREWSERFAPNYRTQEEIDDADRWWRHLNANFWGDIFMKNLGFTVGAGASAFAFSGLSKIAQRAITRSAYKTALAAASGDAGAESALREGFQRILQGEGVPNAGNIPDALYRLGKTYKLAGYSNNLIGATGGAIGESRMEALNAAKEFREKYAMQAEGEMQDEMNALGEEVMSNEDFVTVVNGEPYLTAAGQDYWDAKSKEIQDRYNAKIRQAETEAEDLSRRTFWLNMPLLMGSNLIMFGRLMSGGYKSQAKIKAKGDITSGYTLAGGVGRGIGELAKTSLSEGFEEISQKIFSEGATDIAEHNMSAFNDGQYDKYAIKNTFDALKSIINSAGNVLDDSASWQEFAVGALTGGLSSAVMGGFRDGMGGSETERAMNQEKLDKINERIKDPQFKALWKGLVRHNHYEAEKDRALGAKDEDGNAIGTQFAWHSYDDAQMISDVMMFAEIGRLNELEDMVDSFSDASDEDLQAIREDLNGEQDKDIRNKTDDQLRSWLKERADNLKKTINQYRRIHDSIDYLAAGTTDEAAIEEMVYTKSQIENFEERYESIFTKVMLQLAPKLQLIANESKSDGTLTQRAANARAILENEGLARTMFGGVNQDIRGRAEEGDMISAMSEINDEQKRQNNLRILENMGLFADDPQLKQDIIDLQSLIKARAGFYSKLFFPQNRKSFAENFSENAKTDDDVADELENDAIAERANSFVNDLLGVTGLSSFINKFDELSKLTDKEYNEIAPKVQEAIDADERLHALDERISGVQSFVNKLVGLTRKMSEDNDDPGMVIDLQYIEGLISGENKATDFLRDIPDDEDEIVWAARKVLGLVSGRKRPEQIVRLMMDEVLADKAQANNLGVITPDTDTGGSGNEGNEEAKSQFEKLSDELDLANNLFDPTLTRILDNDFSGYDDLTEEERNTLYAKATAIENRIKTELGLTSGEGNDDLSEQNKEKNETPGDPAVERRKKEYKRREVTAISATRTSVYTPGVSAENEAEAVKKNIPLLERIKAWGLKQGVKKLFKYGNKKKQAIADWLVKHKVQDFIDSGALMKLERAYAAKGERLPIYFVANPHYVEDNLENNPFVELNTKKNSKYGRLAPSVMLAVEMNEENRKILSNYEGTVITDDSLITVNDNGNAVQYQIIGEAWNPSPDELDRVDAEDRNAYENVKNNVQRIWEYTVFESIIPQYNDDVKKDPASFDSEGRWYVARRPAEVGEKEEENNPFVPGYTTEIETSYKTKSGKELKGKYKVDVDGDGYVKVTSPSGKLRRHSTLEELDVSLEDLIGDESEFNDGQFALIREEIEKDGFSVGNIVIRPDGTVSFDIEGVEELGNSFEADRDGTRDVIAKMFPELLPALNANASSDEDTVGERYNTTLNYVMTGRNQTREFGDPEYHKIPLLNSLSEYRKYGGEYYFAMPTKDDVVVVSPDSTITIPLNINAPSGSLWMATRTANGDFSWTYITIARTGEYDFDSEAHANTRLMRDFNTLVERVFRPSSPSLSAQERSADAADRRLACKGLSDMFYFGPSNELTFSYTDTGAKVTIGGQECYDRATFIDTIKNMNVRFQVSTDDVSAGKEAMDDLIDAGILSSEMMSFVRFGATVGVNFMDDVDDQGQKVPLHVMEPKNTRVAFNPGYNYNSVRSNGGVTNIRIGDAGYSIDPDGRVRRMTSRTSVGEEVLDRSLIAEVKATSQIVLMKQSHGTPAANVNMRVIDKSIDTSYVTKDKNGKPVVMPGRRTIEYTELFDVDVDGINVHLISHSKDGVDVTVVNDQNYWDDIWEYSMQFKQNNSRFAKPAESSDEELYAQFAKDEAKKEASAPVTQDTSAPKRKGPKRGGGFGFEFESARTKGTISSLDKKHEDSETEDTNNCG